VGSYRDLLGLNIHFLKDISVQIKTSSASRHNNFLKMYEGLPLRGIE